MGNITEIEVCPSCGDLTDTLNENTGWCYDCSPPQCSVCGGEQPLPDHRYSGFHATGPSIIISRNGEYICKRCIRDAWIERYADQIERYMAEGHGYTEAVKIVSSENRAICVICSKPIPGRHKLHTLFCTKERRCKKAKKKYETLMQRHRLTREIALEQVLREEVLV